MSQDGAQGTGKGLERGLKNRHLSMIAIGGVIGAGLFVGSGAAINEAVAAVAAVVGAGQRARHRGGQPAAGAPDGRHGVPAGRPRAGG